MGAPVPSFRVFGVHRCDVCGMDSSLNYAYCGKVRCGKCDMKRMTDRIANRMVAIWLMCSMFAVMALVMAIAVTLRQS